MSRKTVQRKQPKFKSVEIGLRVSHGLDKINGVNVFHFNQGKEYSVLTKTVHNFGVYIVAFYTFSSFRYIVGNQEK